MFQNEEGRRPCVMAWARDETLMFPRKRHSAWFDLLTFAVLAASVGCKETPPWIWSTFLDPTKVSAGYNRQSISQIQRSLSFEDTPPGVPGAEDPTVDDTVATFEDYRLGVGDQVELRSRNYMERGMESVFQMVVSDAGEIQVPQVGWVQVEGLTAKEVEQELKDQAVQLGLFSETNLPSIQVTILSQRQRLFNISGNVQAPGPYRILEPDFRLIDALSLAGGMPEQSEWIYVYRSQARPRKGAPAAGTARRSAKPAQDTAPVAESVKEAPPVVPASMGDLGTGRSGALAQASPPSSSPVNAERELIEAVAPSAPSTAPQAQTTKQAEPAAVPAAGPKFIYLNGEWVDVSQQPQAQTAPVPKNDTAAKTPSASVSPPDAQPETPPAVEVAAPTSRQGTATTEPVTWESVASEDRQRVIQIPVAALRRGEARYNIVIRHRDFVRVDPGPVGEFFMFGNVARPGAYSLTGRDVTLKQAVASAGGLDLLAWPSRCEIVRRLDQDREQIIPVNLEQIFMGNQDDVYMRPGDIVNVGTNFIAPFLATVRSSFRMSYGFGFVYDRNYGDIDSYGPRTNPEVKDDAKKAARFSNIFR